MIIRLSFLVAASVAAVAVCQINKNSSKKRNSSNIKQSEENGSSFQRMEAEEEEKFTDELSVISVSQSNLLQDEKAQQKEEEERGRKIVKPNLQMDIPKELVHNLVKDLKMKNLILERKLLELYGLEEQQLYFAQLQRNLGDKTAVSETLNDTVNSLQNEVKNLQEEMRHTVLANAELEMAKKMIQKLQMKMDFNESNVKQQLVLLEQQVSRFLCNEDISINKDMIEKKIKAGREVGLEFIKMQRMNKELQLEKRKLTLKLVDAQDRIQALSNMTEDKIIGRIEEEIRNLRHSNEGLSKEVERLQKDRFNMVEELAYQRWLNACLRFETQNYQTPPTRASNSDQKAKQVVLNRGFESISSFSSSSESNVIDSSSTTESSSSSRRCIAMKSGLIHSIKKFGRSKDDSSAVSSPSGNSRRRSLLSRTGLIRRHSTSMIPLRPSLLGEITLTITPSEKKMVHEFSDEPQNTPTFPRKRRVSFSDTVETFTSTFEDSENVEEVADDKEMSDKKSDKNLVKADHPSDSSPKNINNDSMDEQICKGIEIAESQKSHSKISIHLASESKAEASIANGLATAALLFFLFLLLLYLLLEYLLQIVPIRV